MAQALALLPSSSLQTRGNKPAGKKNYRPLDIESGYDKRGYLPVTRLMRQYTDYLTVKMAEIEEQRSARHYYHGSHWTAEEIKILKKRRQPVITYNRINRKIDGIVGLCEKLRQDPKAFPRTPKQGNNAEVATESVRYVLDAMDWRNLDHDCTERAAIEGIGGLALEQIDGDHGDPDLTASYVFGEDFFYDPRSRKPDFSDAMYMGIAKWLDVEVAQEMFPKMRNEIRNVMENGTAFDLAKHADQAYKWIYSNEKRVRLVEHWYKHRSEWCYCFYIAELVLDEGISPFLDERDLSICRFIMFSAAVDQDGDRYGFPRNLKGPQDEINHRRSKALFTANVTRVIMEKGAVDDVETMRREKVRPDGVVEVNPGYFEKIKSDDTASEMAAQIEFLQEAKMEIDSFANVNPALLGQSDEVSEHSGVAIDLIQRAGLAELSKFILVHRTWKLRVYRAIWNTIKDTWEGERWLRIADDQQVQRWLQINGLAIDPMTGRPTLTNSLADLDVDIIMDEGPDVATLMQDAYSFIKDDPTIPPVVKLELSPLPQSVKDRVKDQIKEAQQNTPPDPKTQAQIATEQIKQQTVREQSQAEIQRTNIETQGEMFNAQQDAQSRVQDAQLKQIDIHAAREKSEQERIFAREQHAFKMEELREQAITMKAKHAAMRKNAAQPKKAASK